jgi:hypothetical protein
MDREQEGQTIRQPATANLMIDSVDKTNGTTNSFVISKNEALLNGFFTRVGATELVLNWFEQNYAGGSITFNYGASSTTIFVSSGIYTASGWLNAFVVALNSVSGTTSLTFSAPVINDPSIPGVPVIPVASGSNSIYFSGTTVSSQKFLQQLLFAYNQGVAVAVDTNTPIICSPFADLRPYRYLDFVSNNLTYNQRLKDTTSGFYERQVIVRFYFSSEYPILDDLNYPILPGYTSFSMIRQYNPPKQIRWSSNQPIGQLDFSVYGSDGLLAVMNNTLQTNYQMTLQVSEN